MSDAPGRNSERAVCVVVTAGEEEKQIEACLKTALWADEIVVVDSCSTDRTAEIARRFTDKVYVIPWRGYIGQKMVALEKVEAPWVLFLDADERLTPELVEDVRRELSAPVVPWAGFEFRRKVCYMQRWIRHGDWYPDYKLRLFRRDLGRVGGQEPHDRVVVDGPVKRLRSEILHYTYEDLTDQIRTLNRFSSISARVMFDAGKRARRIDMLIRPLVRFLRFYVLRRGFLDGRPGWIAAVIVSFGVFLKYSKLYELGCLEKGCRPRDPSGTCT